MTDHLPAQPEPDYDTALAEVNMVIATIKEVQQNPQLSEAQQTETAALLNESYKIGAYIAVKRIEQLMSVLRDKVAEVHRDAAHRQEKR